MISESAYLYCKEDISLIENYEQAISDKTQTWDCHHRLETDLVLSKAELIKQDKYLNVPANELIFLTHGEHMKLHMQGKNNPFYNKQHSEETKRKQSERKQEYYKSHSSWNKGGKTSEETKRKQSERKQEYYKSHSPWNKGKKGVQKSWNKGKKGAQQAWNKGMTKEEMKNYKKK